MNIYYLKSESTEECYFFEALDDDGAMSKALQISFPEDGRVFDENDREII